VEKKLVHIIVGPTASGKSEYALKHALQYSGEIINADSMQVYKNFPVLSAQPTSEDKSKAIHHLYGFLDIQSNFNVNTWSELAAKTIENCWDRNVVPVLVGGTGFYIQSILEGLSPIPDIPLPKRKELQDRNKKLRREALYKYLQMKDPEITSKIKPGDTQRICRALEVFEHTEKPLSYWQKLPRKKIIEAEFKVIEIKKERKKLYQDIDNRVRKIIKNGAIEEVETIHNQFPEILYPGQKILGYEEIRNYLLGGWTLDQTIEKLQQHTRNYAKRQMTWLRNQIKIDISL
jgi:tRNA dimethylallyltransferase